MYGHRWVSSFGAEVDPDGTWQAIISGLTSKQVQCGVDACREKCLEWPPSAPEFRKLCLGDNESIEHKNHAIRAAETDRMLQNQQLRLEDAGKRERAINARNTHIDKLRGMLTSTCQ